MPQIARLTAEDRDDLVAYLDGELGDEEGARIEAALASSPVARHEVEMLTRTWDLLDLLPEEGGGAAFTERTLSAARADGAAVPLRDRPAAVLARKAAVAAAWAGALAGCGAVGYLAANRWVPRETDAVVRDLPLLNDLPRLRDAGSVEFLRELDRTGTLRLARPFPPPPGEPTPEDPPR